MTKKRFLKKSKRRKVNYPQPVGISKVSGMKKKTCSFITLKEKSDIDHKRTAKVSIAINSSFPLASTKENTNLKSIKYVRARKTNYKRS